MACHEEENKVRKEESRAFMCGGNAGKRPVRCTDRNINTDAIKIILYLDDATFWRAST